MSTFALPLGFPGWKAWAFLGLPVAIYVDVLRDEEAGVYVATSKHVKGLVIEADSLDGIKSEIEKALFDLLSVNTRSPNRARPIFISMRRLRLHEQLLRTGHQNPQATRIRASAAGQGFTRNLGA